MSQDATAARPAQKRMLSFNNLLGLSLVLVLVLMFVALSIATTTFATPNNLSNLARQGAMIAILAVGQTFVIITAASTSPWAPSWASRPSSAPC